jgi:hypothetical protein
MATSELKPKLKRSRSLFVKNKFSKKKYVKNLDVFIYLGEPTVVQVEYAAPHSVTCLLQNQQKHIKNIA